MKSVLKNLAEEEIVLLKNAKNFKLPISFHGILRIVDKTGGTVGVFLDKETLDDLEEDIESSNPSFIAALEESRSSGRVSGDSVKDKAGL